MPLQPIPIVVDDAQALPAVDFQLRLEVFEGPLQLLLHLIESRQLDVLTVPLAHVADAYVDHLATHEVDPRNLAEFVAIASQLILLKSRHLLPGEVPPAVENAGEEVDEEELRRRLIEYRALRDAARAMGAMDLTAPVYRREPRETDLPEVPVQPIPAGRLAEALEQLASIAEPEPPPPQVVPREVTIAQQIAVLTEALAASGQVVLQAILAACRSRTEATVTFIAALELVRRRRIRAEQRTLFGPILIERLPETSG
jgi:segregation and condensation protein A